MAFQFIHTNYSHPHFQELIVILDNEFMERYPQNRHKFNSANALSSEARVMLAYEGDVCIACGAFRPVTKTTIEIKRMFTLPAYRNKGIGKQILYQLELWAKSEGFAESILETGIKQPEAIRVYIKSGYQQIPNYSPYENVIESVCYRKIL